MTIYKNNIIDLHDVHTIKITKLNLLVQLSRQAMVVIDFNVDTDSVYTVSRVRYIGNKMLLRRKLFATTKL